MAVVVAFGYRPGENLDLKEATSRAAEHLNLPKASGRWLAIQPMPPVDGGLEIIGNLKTGLAGGSRCSLTAGSGSGWGSGELLLLIALGLLLERRSRRQKARSSETREPTNAAGTAG